MSLAVASGVASAHTEFESSDPTDGAVVADPLDRVTISFTSAATPTGDGFRALDATGTIREPTEVIAVDDRSYELRFDPPLAGGEIGISWSVRAGDAHPISGAFSFTVVAGPPTTAAATTTPTTTTIGAAPSATDTVGDTDDARAGAVDADPPVAGDGDAPVALDDFLASAVDDSSDTVGRIGRTVSLLAVVVGLGVLAFSATAMRGSRTEIRAALLAAQVAGGVLAVGAVVEFAGLVSSTGDGVGDVLTGSAGIATALRFAGGVVLAAGLVSASDSIVPARRRALSAAVAVESPASEPSEPTAPVARWVPDRRVRLAGAGAVAIVASFWFDGHTVTTGWRPLHALVDTVHVVAGSVWVGGVATMAALLWSRRRRGRPARAAELVVRFSPIATVALVAVAGAGVLMTSFVLDEPGDLVTTEWGQVLLLKVGAVAIAAAVGGYNHVRLRPMLDGAPTDEVLAERLRTSVTVEAILLVFVVAVTAVLVAAATS